MVSKPMQACKRFLEAFDLNGYSVGSKADSMNPVIPSCLLPPYEFGTRKVGDEKQLQLQTSCFIQPAVQAYLGRASAHFLIRPPSWIQ